MLRKIAPRLHFPMTIASTQILLPNNANLAAECLRHYPARGTKPPPRYNFDFKDLEAKTDGKYTHLPLKIRKMGGRDPETGHKVNRHIGGGVKFDYFMVDVRRHSQTVPNETYDERVIEIRHDPNRTPHLALVAGTKGKRWIYATQNMEAGQIIQTSSYIPDQPILGREGNSYPIGALIEGTLVNSLELYPEEKTHVCITEAGSSASIIRHQGEYTVVKMANRHEYALKRECMATVGRLSHMEYPLKIFGSAQMHRRFGYRMAGSLKKKKTGYDGRKIRKLPPVRTFDKPAPIKFPREKWTLTKKQLSGLYGTAAADSLVTSFNNTVRF